MTMKHGTVFVPHDFSQTKPSKDGQTHVCMITHYDNTPTATPSLICVYRPAGV